VTAAALTPRRPPPAAAHGGGGGWRGGRAEGVRAARAGERAARTLGARAGLSGRVGEAIRAVGVGVGDLDAAARAAGWRPDAFDAGRLVLWTDGGGGGRIMRPAT